jgi:hypothetical protein
MIEAQTTDEKSVGAYRKISSDNASNPNIRMVFCSYTDRRNGNMPRKKGFLQTAYHLNALLHRVPPVRPTLTIQGLASDGAAPPTGSVVWFSIRVAQCMLL